MQLAPSCLLLPPSSAAAMGGRHRLVPFVLEEGGRFGDHALAILSEIADRLTLEPRQANLRPRSPGPAPIPRQPRLIGCAQVEAGGLGLVAGHHVCHVFARHLVPLCTV